MRREAAIGEILRIVNAASGDLAPGMDELTLLGEIKRRWPELPVMMVTAYRDEERRRTASEYGAAQFVTKPVDFEFLKQQLQQLPHP